MEILSINTLFFKFTSRMIFQVHLTTENILLAIITTGQTTEALLAIIMTAQTTENILLAIITTAQTTEPFLACYYHYYSSLLALLAFLACYYCNYHYYSSFSSKINIKYWLGAKFEDLNFFFANHLNLRSGSYYLNLDYLNSLRNFFFANHLNLRLNYLNLDYLNLVDYSNLDY